MKMAGSKNPGYPNVVAARSAADDTPTDILMDPTSFALYTGNWVWNATTLVWEKMSAPEKIYGYNGTNWHEIRIDTATRTLQNIEYEHHEIHSGSHYFVTGYQDLSINNVLDFTWLMPNTTKWIHWTWHISTESETLWQIYENVSATNPLANAVTPLNSNRNSGNTSGTTMKYELQADLAAANADTDVSGGTLIASGVSGAGKDSGAVTRNHELVLDQSVLYCLRATANAAGNVSFDMQWYEHTDKIV